MKVITVASLKGGVGKTAIAVFLSQALSSLGKSVLVMDLDPNNNLTDYFLRGVDPARIESRNMIHWITGKSVFADCVYESTQGVLVLPCTSEIVLREIGEKAQLRFSSQFNRPGFDVVVVDTPPSFSNELTLGLLIAHTVLTPVGFGRWNAQGIAMLRGIIVNRRGPGAPGVIAVPSIVTASQAAKLRVSFPNVFTKSEVLRSGAVKTACENGKRLSEKSKSWKEFINLAKELCE